MTHSTRAVLVLGALALAGCSVNLQHQLSEDDANDIYVLLQENGIDVRKIQQASDNEPKYIISVAKADVAHAAKLLREHSLPRPKAKGLSAFRESKGMIPTATEERAMMLEALGGEVENSLNRIPGVLEAKVIANMPEENDLTQPEKKPQPSAAVFVKYRPVDGKSPITDEHIRTFVAAALPEMRKEYVAVLLTPAQPFEAEDPSKRFVEIIGIQMTKGSADRFKVVMGLTALLVLGMGLITIYTMVRGGGATGAQRPRPRRQPEG